jgi:3-oxoacyl-(acyl-carrier-protein) synthase
MLANFEFFPMSPYITGARWITPLGTGDSVFDAILAGTPAPVTEIPGPPGSRPHFAALIPPEHLDGVAKLARLRRSSKISLAAADAAFVAGARARTALAATGTDLEAMAGRVAIIFATSDGGVIYTRKFYDQVVRQGAGSPLLFPETVYNAPASHIAAMHNIDGITYTLVGDASVGLSALHLGVDLIASGQADHCIVTGAEEIDWILCEAYIKWRLASASIQIGSNRGALIAEGAAAIVLSRDRGDFKLDAVTPGVPFFRQSEAASSLAASLKQLPPSAPTRVISSANGTFIDHAERTAIESVFGHLPTLFPKVTLGDPFGASALMQIICALHSLKKDPAGPVLVPVIGLNHQAAAALISAEK